MGKTESQRSFARTTRAHLAKTAALILLTALAAATLLSSCAQEEALPNEARIDSTTFRYPDTAKPHKDEPSSSTVKTAGGFTYTEKHLDFQNDERTLFFVVHLCEGISYDDALAYAKTAPNATSGGETSEDEVALLEKHQIDPAISPRWRSNLLKKPRSAGVTRSRKSRRRFKERTRPCISSNASRRAMVQSYTSTRICPNRPSSRTKRCCAPSDRASESTKRSKATL